MGLLGDGRLSDVTLVAVEGGGTSREFRCHKAILAAWSRPFAAMFAHPMRESAPDARVAIEGACPEPLQELLEFLYGGRLNLRDVSVLPLLALANRYEVTPLMRHCEAYVRWRLSPRSAPQWLVAAWEHRCDGAVAAVLHYVAAHFDEVCDEEAEGGDLSLSLVGGDALLRVLQHPDLTADEETVFSAVERWAVAWRRRAAFYLDVDDDDGDGAGSGGGGGGDGDESSGDDGKHDDIDEKLAAVGRGEGERPISSSAFCRSGCTGGCSAGVGAECDDCAECRDASTRAAATRRRSRRPKDALAGSSAVDGTRVDGSGGDGAGRNRRQRAPFCGASPSPERRSATLIASTGRSVHAGSETDRLQRRRRWSDLPQAHVMPPSPPPLAAEAAGRRCGTRRKAAMVLGAEAVPRTPRMRTRSGSEGAIASGGGDSGGVVPNGLGGGGGDGGNCNGNVNGNGNGSGGSGDREGRHAGSTLLGMPEEERRQLNSLLSHVRFPLASTSFLCNVVEASPVAAPAAAGGSGVMRALLHEAYRYQALQANPEGTDAQAEFEGNVRVQERGTERVLFGEGASDGDGTGGSGAGGGSGCMGRVDDYSSSLSDVHVVGNVRRRDARYWLPGHPEEAFLSVGLDRVFRITKVSFQNRYSEEYRISVRKTRHDEWRPMTAFRSSGAHKEVVTVDLSRQRVKARFVKLALRGRKDACWNTSLFWFEVSGV
ncbi:unnamed protein product [Phaeothamnion confervicola]